MRIFDGHVYVGHKPAFAQFGVPAAFTDDAVIRRMDEAGVERIIAAPPGLIGDDYSAGNALLAETAKRHPGRIHGYARIHPLTMPKPAETAEYWIRQGGLHGLKLNAATNSFYVNDRSLVHPMIERIAGPHTTVLVHTGESRCSTPALVADLALDFPEVSFIVGHMGQLNAFADALAMARRIPNLYLDTAFNGTPNTIREAVRTLGAHRVLYGSNGPYLPFEIEIEKITRFARLTDAELALVMGGNLARILGV